MTTDDTSRGARRPLFLDATHLVARLSRVRTSGIDKVDLAFARHFSAQASEKGAEPNLRETRDWPNFGVSHYGLRSPRVHGSHAIHELLNKWSDVPADRGFIEASQWLARPANNATEPLSSGPTVKIGLPWPDKAFFAAIERRNFQVRWLLSSGAGGFPRNTIYLNIAQHLLEHRRNFAWLGTRQDVTAVFFVHDLVPFDWPEYFPKGYRDRFERRWQTIQEFAGAIITSSICVRLRLEEEFRRRKRRLVPIHVAPLPPPLEWQGVAFEPALLAVPYFIVVGTIEPRKNHLLLLNIWRRMAETGVPPKLLVVGKRGWENEQILDVLDRSSLVRPHVLEMSNMGEQALARLIKNARALLLPSFAEGYGLPLVEALALGTPVIASDIPVFREVGRNAAIYKHPLDGPGWWTEISRLAVQSATAAVAERKPSLCLIDSLSWPHYFEGVEAFFQQLGTHEG